jgi:hypothetical protein
MTATAAARRAEIDRRYKADKRERPFSIAVLRLKELQRLFTARHRYQLPNDDAGRDDPLIMAHHLARHPAAEHRIASMLSLWAPWMSATEAGALTAKVIAKPLRWRADTLGRRLGLTEAERQRLKITTIGAIDVTKDERIKSRRERDRARHHHHRRAQGATPRDEYEANSISRTRPWEALGMSRRSWHRAGKPATPAAA